VRLSHPQRVARPSDVIVNACVFCVIHVLRQGTAAVRSLARAVGPRLSQPQRVARPIDAMVEARVSWVSHVLRQRTAALPYRHNRL